MACFFVWTDLDVDNVPELKWLSMSSPSDKDRFALVLRHVGLL